MILVLQKIKFNQRYDKNAVENIPNALPAIKTNVGEFVEVTFNYHLN
ncbi:MAG: hypothetical protein CM15mP102_09310 [Flavobacteriales bacterium]|nr:MAG: hypothetical protein CM15mP102_09310 [Flavobacteriales bacterium]